LSAIPLASGAFRLVGLGGGPELMPANERFAASPLPVVLHIVSVSIFAILGAFQFSTGLRRGRPGWHRAAGRLVVACGLLVGLSGLWLTLFYSHPDGSQPLLYALRLLFGSAMVVCILLGFAAILRRDVNRHRAWMTRGYAIGLGAGTQALTLLVGEVILGPPTELSRALLMGAAWVINLGVAEWVIGKRPASHHSSLPLWQFFLPFTNTPKHGVDELTGMTREPGVSTIRAVPAWPALSLSNSAYRRSQRHSNSRVAGLAAAPHSARPGTPHLRNAISMAIRMSASLPAGRAMICSTQRLVRRTQRTRRPR
jgi:uncharacterized membrane protein